MQIVTSNHINIITFVIAIFLSIFLVEFYKYIVTNILLIRFKRAKANSDKNEMAQVLLVMKNKSLLTKRVKSIVESEMTTICTNNID